jgi:amidohydrolase
MRNEWSGTLIVVFQQAEERGTGAQAMVDGGLYDKIPVPDIVLGQHVMPFKSGTIGSKSKVIMGACDSYKITMFGRGGHGAVPHTTIDPVLMASNLVVRLQNIVSREVDVINDSAVVTVGSIHGGFAENIIPASVEIGVDIRTVDTATRDRVIDSIWRKTRAEALASGAEKEPTMVQTRTFPLTYNEPTDEERIDAAFQQRFSSRYRRLSSSIPMSEDVAILATSQNKPCVFWHIGGVEPSLWDECEKEGTVSARIPSNHSDRFAPAIHPTLETGIDALCIAALTYLKK